MSTPVIEKEGAPSPYSPHNPKLQMAWDSTSLRHLMTCPRQYQYAILEGYRTDASQVDLEFGGFFASAVEHYKKCRLMGHAREVAHLKILAWVIQATWKDGKPWGGTYEDQWKCSGTEPYRNEKGNKAKCPYSHAVRWFYPPAPAQCGTCGSPTHNERRWDSDNPAKDRNSLIRLVSWYIDEQPETKGEGGLYPYMFQDGTYAVELSFSFPTTFKNSHGEPFVLAGHLDSISTFGDELWVTDNKTTKKMLNQNYYAQYAPNLQVDLYDLAASVLYSALGVKGVLIEAAQTMATGARFGMLPVRKSEKQREEFYKELGWWFATAETHAKANYWPMNRAACFLCPYKTICSKEEQVREMYLKADFVVKKWNPLEER